MTTIRTSCYSLFSLMLITVVSSSMAQAPVRGSSLDTSQRLARIEQLLNNQGLVDMLQQLEALQQEISQLRGEIEVQDRNIDELRRRQRALYTDIDQRLQGMERNVVSDFSTLTPEVAGNPPLQTLSPVYGTSDRVTRQSAENSLSIEILPTSPTQQQPDTALNTQYDITTRSRSITLAGPTTVELDVDPVQVQADYQQAFDLLKQSQYEMAIQSFRSFLGNYPASDYSDNAQYWLGEAHYVTRQFEQALEEYYKLVSNFPQSQKYTHALLKIGYSYHELGRIDEAKKYLQTLTQQYPGTTASRLAEERLRSIALTQQQTNTTEN